MTSTLLSEAFIKNLRKTAKVLDSLNHVLRKRILDEIIDYGALNVEALSSILNVRSSLISQHVEILRKEDILDLQLEGKQLFYAVNHERLAKINYVIRGLAED
ncbi:MAG: hypothetical protein AAGJ18_14240 [Bacteroidota bacterium]